MAKEKKELVLSEAEALNKTYLVRRQKIMLDADLAELYGVPTKALNQSVKRNIERFPGDFMFRVTETEWKCLRSQIVTSNAGRGGSRYQPYAFTEHGVAMLSSVLSSETAIEVNIQIIRVFTRMRQILLTHKDILLHLEKIEKKLMGHDQELQLVFSYLKQLLTLLRSHEEGSDLKGTMKSHP